MTSSSSPRRTEPRGFSLLEVMCAFAILAMMTGLVTRMFNSNIRKATTALSNRELREAADTIFRKMIYEWHKYEDGQTRTLDMEFQELYGGRPDGPRQLSLEYWQIYTYVLEKKEKAVAGSDNGAKDGSLFEQDAAEQAGFPTNRNEGSVGSGTGTGTRTTGGTTGNGTADGQEDPTGVRLVQLTMKIYLTSEGSNTEPEMVLSTWIDPRGAKEGIR